MKKLNKTKIRQRIRETFNIEKYDVLSIGSYSWNEIEDTFYDFCECNGIEINTDNLKEKIFLNLDTDDGYPVVSISYKKTLTKEEIDAKVEEIYKSEMERYTKYLKNQKESKLNKAKEEKAMYEKLKKKYGGSKLYEKLKKKYGGSK